MLNPDLDLPFLQKSPLIDGAPSPGQNWKRYFDRIHATKPPLSTLGVELDPRGNVRANTADYQTSLGKVFSAGDMRRGQSLVVWAIREGRLCARAIDEFLMGTTSLPK